MLEWLRNGKEEVAKMKIDELGQNIDTIKRVLNFIM